MRPTPPLYPHYSPHSDPSKRGRSSCPTLYNFFYYTSNKDLIEECAEEENLEITGVGTTSCLREECKTLRPMSRFRPITVKLINNQSTLRTAPDLYKNVSFAVLFGWLVCLFVCFWRDSPPVGQGFLVHEVSRSHTTTRHSR